MLKNIVRIGKNCRIQRNVYFGDGNNVEIGNNCQINENVRLDNVKIGNSVMIARDAVFLGKMHNFSSVEIPMNEQEITSSNRTVIENDVWIGIRVIVMPGISISKGSIVAAGAVLTKDTVPYGIYAGVPAKLIRLRKDTQI